MNNRNNKRINDMMLNDFANLDLSDIRSPMVVLYNTTTIEYSGQYVARLFEAAIPAPTNCVVIAKTYEELVGKVCVSFNVKLERNPEDVQEIIECWIK